MSLRRSQVILLGFTAALTAYWLGLHATHHVTGTPNYLYSFALGLMPLVGGIWALLGARRWGGLNSAMGQAALFLGIGLALWGGGEIVLSYYNFFGGQAVPYPSWADLGFGPSIFFWVSGVFFLSRANGARLGWRSIRTRVALVIALAVALVASYYLLVVVARDGIVSNGGGELKILLDVFYPLGDFLALSFAIGAYTLSRGRLGGNYKQPIFSILTGLAVMFLADFIFAYTTTKGTYYNGDLGDLMLMMGLALITYGSLGLGSGPLALKDKKRG